MNSLLFLRLSYTALSKADRRGGRIKMPESLMVRLGLWQAAVGHYGWMDLEIPFDAIHLSPLLSQLYGERQS